MSYNFLGEVVVIRQLGISSLDKLPGIGILLHHPNNIIPVVGIDAAQRLAPQVSILMQRQLGINLAQVKMNLSLVGKAITLALLRLEMTNLTGFTLVLLGILQDSAVLAVISANRNTHSLQMVNHSTTSFTVLKGETTGNNR